MKNAPVRHALEYAFALPVLGLVAILPHAAVRRLGAALGALAGRLVARRRRLVLDNLRQAFPELSAEERQSVASACFRHFGAVFLDSLAMVRFSPPELCDRIDWEGFDHLVEAERAGRGVIYLSAHFGNWEAAANGVGALRGPVAVVGRPVDNPHVDRLVHDLRTHFGNRLLPKRGSVRDMFRVLASGGRLGLLIDQRVRADESIDVPFFGRPARTSPIVARLALKTGAAVVPIAAHHLPGGRYRVVVDPPIWPEGRDDPENSFAFTRRCLEAGESAIRRHPEQWLWMHDRWKH
ncbi:MAG: lysophospholipid acyltransferase family protein [Holophagales bacterium]|nr:lysophospholipid acyltransferase family protein [Holophagales bacterium]